jgi:hypothetical protein
VELGASARVRLREEAFGCRRACNRASRRRRALWWCPLALVSARAAVTGADGVRALAVGVLAGDELFSGADAGLACGVEDDERPCELLPWPCAPSPFKSDPEWPL